MHWKIARDPYLAPLCAVHGEAAALDAGFFYDEDPDDAALDDVDWLCTPRPKRAATGDRPVVLLATGGFSPVHAGHLEMMDRARAAAEGAGLEVVGGYLSPGHDAYLRLKCGDAALPVAERLARCADAVGGTWLSVDPWEAMHRRVSVNYTDVAARLERYLRHHVHPGLEVAYVCGGDNARFAFGFSERGRCIVVGRPGSEVELERWRSRLTGNGRLLFVDGDHPASSRALRDGPVPASPRPRLAVRCEDQRSVRTLGLPDVEAFRAFQAELLDLLGREAEVRAVALVDRPDDRPTISLDPMLPAAHGLAISRLYAPGGYEALGFVARPDHAPLEVQAAQVPPGSYVLRDDDSISGRTVLAAKALLSDGVDVASVVLAVETEAGEDVVDARDFLLGSDDGGLVVQLPDGRIGRAPYLLPYVDPAARASIAASHGLSIEVWRLNARFFAPTDLRTGDLPAPARRTFEPLGDLRLDDLCRWHVERLERTRPT